MTQRRLLIFALVGLSLGLSWYFARQGPTGPSVRSDCLTHADCQSSELCVVVPKGDGFASFGVCGEKCLTDDGCANGWTCRAWVEDKGYLLPDRGHSPDEPRKLACAHHTVQ